MPIDPLHLCHRIKSLDTSVNLGRPAMLEDNPAYIVMVKIVFSAVIVVQA